MGGGGGGDDNDDGESNFDGGNERDCEANALTTRLRRQLMRSCSNLRTSLLSTRREDYSKSGNFLGREGGRGPDARVAIFQGKIGAL